MKNPPDKKNPAGSSADPVSPLATPTTGSPVINVQPLDLTQLEDGASVRQEVSIPGQKGKTVFKYTKLKPRKPREPKPKGNKDAKAETPAPAVVPAPAAVVPPVTEAPQSQNTPTQESVNELTDLLRERSLQDASSSKSGWIWFVLLALAVAVIGVATYFNYRATNSIKKSVDEMPGIVESRIKAGFEGLQTWFVGTLADFGKKRDEHVTSDGDLTRQEVCNQQSLVSGLSNEINKRNEFIGRELTAIDEKFNAVNTRFGAVETTVKDAFEGIKERVDEAVNKAPTPVVAPEPPAVSVSAMVAPVSSGLPGKPVVITDELGDWLQNYYGIGKKSYKIHSWELRKNRLVRVDYQAVPNWQDRVYVEMDPTNRWFDERVLLSDLINKGKIIIEDGEIVLPDNISWAKFYIRDLRKGEVSDGATLPIRKKKVSSDRRWGGLSNSSSGSVRQR